MGDSIVERIARFSLGKYGRKILDFIIKNNWIFILVFGLYALLITYASIIKNYYIPGRINWLIKNYPGVSQNKIIELWEKEKSELPDYILVPSEKNMWVRRLNTGVKEYKNLFHEKTFTNEDDLIEELYNK